MGKLSSFIKLEGTLDGLTFYKSQNGYLVRTKGGVTKRSILLDSLGSLARLSKIPTESRINFPDLAFKPNSLMFSLVLA